MRGGGHNRKGERSVTIYDGILTELSYRFSCTFLSPLHSISSIFNSISSEEAKLRSNPKFNFVKLSFIFRVLSIK